MKKTAIIAVVALAMMSCAGRGSNSSTATSEASPAASEAISETSSNSCGDCASCPSKGCSATTTDCSAEAANDCSPAATSDAATTVIYFHGKQRCVTCQAIERIAKETVEAMKNEAVAFKVIDFSTPEGEKVADEYRVSSSSLFVVRGDSRKDLTREAFRNAKNNPAELAKVLTEAINAAQ